MVLTVFFKYSQDISIRGMLTCQVLSMLLTPSPAKAPRMPLPRTVGRPRKLYNSDTSIIRITDSWHCMGIANVIHAMTLFNTIVI